jgi:hypothetical protein
MPPSDENVRCVRAKENGQKGSRWELQGKACASEHISPSEFDNDNTTVT